jgi:hypothetical protein
VPISAQAVEPLMRAGSWHMLGPMTTTTRATPSSAGTRFKIVLAVVVVAAVAVAMWLLRSSDDGEQLHGSFSSPVYPSIEDLSAASDLIVQGEIVSVLGRELDFGTADVAERIGEVGVPFAYYEVHVSDVLKGEAPGTIVVGKVDGERLISDEVTPLEPGDTVVLFLMAQEREKDSPGLTMYDFYYTSLSLDAGVFDVSPDGSVTPRAPDQLPEAERHLTLRELADKVVLAGS